MRLSYLTSCIEYLAERGNLVRVTSEVDPTYELAGIAKKFEGKKCVLLERVQDSDYSVLLDLPTTSNSSNPGRLDIRALEARETDREKTRKKTEKPLCQGTLKQPYYRVSQKELPSLARTCRLCGMWLSRVL